MASAEPHVLALIRFRAEHAQRCRNSIIKDLPILRNYRGKPIGIGAPVETVKGHCQSRKAVAVLEFESMRECRLWYDSTPDVKQPDWLDGADIIGVPMLTSFTSDQMWVTVMDVMSMECMKLCEQCDRMKHTTSVGGGWLAVTNNIVKFRGHWAPQFIVIQQASDRAALDKWMETKQCAQCQELNTCAAVGSIIIFPLTQIIVTSK